MGIWFSSSIAVPYQREHYVPLQFSCRSLRDGVYPPQCVSFFFSDSLTLNLSILFMKTYSRNPATQSLKKGIKTFSFVLTALFLAALGAEAKDAQVKRSFHFNVKDLTFEEKGEYDLVSLKGCVFPEDEPGTPLLPALYVNILVPAGSTVKDVTATVQKEELVGTDFNIYPAQTPTPLDENIKPLFTKKNEEAYKKTSKKAISSSSNPQTTRGMTIVPVRLNPVRVVPATGELYLATDIEVVVTVDKPAQKLTVKGGKAFDEFSSSVKKNVVNPDEPDGIPAVQD